MKKLCLTLLFLLCMIGTSHANWKNTFKVSEFKQDLDTAVMRTLAEGVSTSDILEFAYLDLHIDPEKVFISMYCAGIKSPEIVRLSKLFFIPLSKAIEAFKESTLKCEIGTV